MRIVSVRATLALAPLPACAALAGPPYLTDDPQPTDRGQWEVYGFVTGTHVAHDTGGAAGLDINYGGANNLQLTAVVPLNYARDNGRFVFYAALKADY